MRAAAATLFIAGMLPIASIAAQTTSTSSPKSIELTGCVSGQPTVTGSFTLTDVQSGGKYRLTGKQMRKYAGKMVAVLGGASSKRFTVNGGLWPSPNIAAQGGAIDPAEESIARQPGGAASGARADFPEFRVVRVRTLDGACR